MAKTNKLDLISERLDGIEKDISSLKIESKKHGWNV